MAVTKQTQSSEEKNQEDEQTKDLYNKVGDSLVDGLDLDLDDSKKDDSEDEEEEETPKKKKVSKDREEDEEEEDEDKEEDDEDDEDEEEVVPVSKMKKRLNAEKMRRQVAEARVKELEDQKPGQNATRRQRLESMTPEQLRQLQENAEDELDDLIDSGEDKERRKQLRSLVREIGEVVQEAPKRFQKKQISAYDKELSSILSDDGYEHIDFDNASVQQEIKKFATQIYSKYADLQKMETGQATALRLAVDHYSQLKKSPGSGKTDIKSKQALNKLKRKTALDASTQQGNQRVTKADLKKKRSELRKEPNKMKREEFIMDNLLEVDKYLPASLR